MIVMCDQMLRIVKI